MPMSMTLKFRNLAQFVFMEWQSTDALGLILGCFCCMLLAFAMLALPQFKRRILKSLQSTQFHSDSIVTDSDGKVTTNRLNMKQRVASVFIAVLHAFLHVIIMIIIMNMNFYVIFAIVVGASLGYLATSEDYCAKKADHKCCGLKSNFNKGELVQEQTERP